MTLLGSGRKAEEAVARLRTALDTLQAFKGDPLMDGAERSFDAAAGALEERRFRAASGHAEEGMVPVQEMRRQRQEAVEMADRLAKRIQECRRLGIDVERAHRSLEKGRAALKKDHREALALLMRASVELIEAGTGKLSGQKDRGAGGPVNRKTGEPGNR